MRRILSCIITLAFLLTSEMTEAQVTRIQPFRPPTLHTSMGAYRDSAQVPYEQMKNLVSQPLIVKDSASNIYQITSFQVIYRRLGVTENEKTKKILPSYTFANARFSQNTLSELWQKIIREDCKPTESLHFFTSP